MLPIALTETGVATLFGSLDSSRRGEDGIEEDETRRLWDLVNAEGDDEEDRLCRESSSSVSTAAWTAIGLLC